ncbi:MAG: tyrosine-type recombinase/integrase [Desulfobacula sp.]|nr:tyrosine-type recombinase/integrase [Desulfobacula sp.]
MDNLIQKAKTFEQSLLILNRSKRTVKEIIRKLNRFFKYLKTIEINNIDAITKEVVKAYQVEVYLTLNVKGYPNSIAYQNSMLCAVKQFTAFLWEEGLIISNPGKDIQYAKLPKTLPKSILSKSESRKILNAPDTKSVIGYRDRVMLEVLYSSGIRKKELRLLTLNDVDYHDGFLRVMGKGNKERIVPVGRIACRYLENYVKSVRPELIKDPYNNTLFLSSRGQRLNHNAVWVMVKKYGKRAKIKKNISTHTFRHTCATAMLRNKADIRSIQELLGHSSLNSTQVYTRVSITDLKEVHRRCHPREQDRE